MGEYVALHYISPRRLVQLIFQGGVLKRTGTISVGRVLHWTSKKQTCESPPEIPVFFECFFRFAKNMLQWSDFKYNDIDRYVFTPDFVEPKTASFLIFFAGS